MVEKPSETGLPESEGFCLYFLFPHIALRICSEELFICPEEGGIVSESAAEVDASRGFSGGKERFCAVESLYAYILADGVTGCLFYDTVELGFAHEELSAEGVQ